jgi:hypothetical protein
MSTKDITSVNRPANNDSRLRDLHLLYWVLALEKANAKKYPHRDFNTFAAWWAGLTSTEQVRAERDIRDDYEDLEEPKGEGEAADALLREYMTGSN